MGSLDVITVVAEPATGLELTQQSVERLGALGVRVNWIVIVGQDSASIRDRIENGVQSRIQQLIIRQQRSDGIYGAINEGLELVTEPFFMIIHAGDVVLAELAEEIDQADPRKVTCFQSAWHDDSGIPCPYRKGEKPSRVLLGRMPNHQAMLFPRDLAGEKYDETLPISSDLDLKMRLHTAGRLSHKSLKVTSSMVEGISAAPLSFRTALSRTLETNEVLVRHFSRGWALFLSVVYGARYASRIRRLK